MKKKITLTLILFLLLTTFLTINVQADTNIGCYPSSNMVTVGDTFNVTIWLDTNESIGAWLIGLLNFNETFLGIVNADSVLIAPYWSSGFYDNGFIHNDTGNITDVQAFIMVGSTTNTTLFTVNFTALETGICHIKLTEAEAYSEGPNVLDNWYNTFLTIYPKKPTGFSTTSLYQNRIDLNWVKQAGMQKTLVRYKVGSYPSSVTDGIELYNDTEILTSHTGLGSGVIIYYSAWGWNETTGLYSLNYETVIGETVTETSNITVEIESTQFVILIQIFLLVIFLWLGYKIPLMDGNNKSLHYMPFSGGLFVIFAGLDFISFAILINNQYSLGFVGGFLTIVGIILLLYGVLKAFYYE